MEFVYGALVALGAVGGLHLMLWRDTNKLGVVRQKNPRDGVWRFRIRNDGSQKALGVEVFAFGCSPRRFEESEEWWCELAPGERAHIRFTNVASEDAWVVVMWRTSRSFLGRRHAKWFAVQKGSPLYMHRIGARRGRRLRRCIALQLDRRVGPSHAVGGNVRQGRWLPVPPQEVQKGPRLRRWRLRLAAWLRGSSPPTWATDRPKRDYAPPTR